jgi:uncharacterized protein DUF6520
MKKIKVLLYSGAFVLALSASFAFKASPNQTFNAFLKAGTPSCNSGVNCNGGMATCVISGQSAFTDQGSCMILAHMH